MVWAQKNVSSKEVFMNFILFFNFTRQCFSRSVLLPHRTTILKRTPNKSPASSHGYSYPTKLSDVDCMGSGALLLFSDFHIKFHVHIPYSAVWKPVDLGVKNKVCVVFTFFMRLHGPTSFSENNDAVVRGVNGSLTYTSQPKYYSRVVYPN